MPTYNAGAVADTVIAYQKPITLQQGRGLRDNPLAIAEGAAGAPKVQGIALGNVFLGNVTGSGTTGAGVVGLGTPKIVLIDLFASSRFGTIVRLRFSDDDGSTWGAWQNVVGPVGSSTGANNQILSLIRVDVETGSFRSKSTAPLGLGDTLSAYLLSGTLTVPSGVNGIQVSINTSDGYNADFYCLGGNA